MRARFSELYFVCLAKARQWNFVRCNIVTMQSVQSCVGKYTLVLRPYTTNIIHCAVFPAGPVTLPMWGIIAAPAEDITPANAQVRVAVEEDSGAVAFSTIEGEGLTTLLACAFTPVEVSREATFQVTATFAASDDEQYYGLGQHQYDLLDQRGKRVQVWHTYSGEAGEGESIGVPFLVTNRHFGLIFDNPSRVTAALGIDGTTTWTAEVGEALSFFLIYGETTDDIYAGYRHLTGVTPLPPKAGLGYIQCKQRYKTQAEVLQVAEGYRQRGYPCDMLVVNWFHWKTLGDLDLDPEYWPDPAGMTATLRTLGYRTMISVWPRFMDSSRYYRELAEKGWLMHDLDGQMLNGTPDDPRGAVIDTTNPACREWYWQRIRENYAGKGFSAWWTDENEPDVCPHPFALHAGTGARVHNLYPLTHTQAVYEGHRRDLAERCLILSRSAYLGAQRYGTTCWSSDIAPTWDVYRRQYPAGLNFCASGFAYWSSDIGGWLPLDHVPKHTPERLLLSPDAAREVIGEYDDYPELYVRWFQYSAFCPTFRAHGTRSENEVWSLGPEVEAILVQYLRLRYRLLPYIYAQAFRTYRTGAPFMRALFMDFPHDRHAAGIKDQYMFGPALLVAPVTEQAATARTVYLPAGSDWYDFWTNAWHAGGQTLHVEAPIERMPLFVRAGSVLPLGEIIQHTGQPQRIEEIRVYAGTNGACTLYQDDGISNAYEDGAYQLTTLTWHDATERLTVDGEHADWFNAPVAQLVSLVRKTGEA